MSLTPEQTEKVNAAAREGVEALLEQHPEYKTIAVQALVDIFTSGMIAGLNATVGVFETVGL